MHLFFLEAGEGEAVYLEKRGARILIDAGDLVGGFRVLKFLEKRRVKSLDLFLVTHAHLDHLGGVFHVFQGLPCRLWGDSGERLSFKKEAFRWYVKLFRKGKYRAFKRGDEFLFGRLYIKVLWPAYHRSLRNDNSLVLKVKFGRFSALLMGDATGFVEDELLRLGDDLKADILKVGHHGASDATTSEFLDAVSPRYAVICACRNHYYGYPSEEVVERLKARGIEVFITNRCKGRVSFKISPKGLTPCP